MPPRFRLVRPNADNQIKPRLRLQKTEQQKRKEPKRAKKAQGLYGILILDNGTEEPK